MAKKGKARADSQIRRTGPGAGTALRTVVRIFFAIALVAGVVTLAIRIGNRAGERVVDNERYSVRTETIAVAPPPGRDAARFLTEVRYLANLPETLQYVDNGLETRLRDAFAKHPWVAEIRKISISNDGKIAVELKYRTPVLAVTVTGEPRPRAVDASAVLLPDYPEVLELPLLVTAVLPPTLPEGRIWDDPTVRRAAELAATRKPLRLEKGTKSWKITERDGTVIQANL